MSHEISFAGLTGMAEAVYRNVPAWHGLGQVFDSQPGERLTSDRAMALAGLDWNVQTKPLHLSDGTFVPNFNATVRSDTGAVLGVVGDRYVPFSNGEAFAFLDSFVEDGALEYEAAFALRGGKTVVLLARMPEVDTIADGDEQMRYLFAYTAHDGSSPLYLQPTSMRIQCANMARIALSQKTFQVSVKHTASMGTRLAEAKQYLSQFNAGFTEYRDTARILATKRYTQEQSVEFLRTLFPEPAQDTNAKAHAIWLKRCHRLIKAIRHESNQLPSIRGTFWQLVNAVTFDVDHESRTRGKSNQERNENRFLNVSNGPAAELKDRAFALALEMAV